MKIQIHHFLACLVVLDAAMPAVSRAEIDFFQTPAEQKAAITKESSAAARGTKMVKVLFFIAPGCSACPDEATKLESELRRIGLKYRIEGIFVGDPPQIGKYLAALRTYPFKFEIALDMDGKKTKQHGVKTFPSAVIEVDGKKFVIMKAAELEAKLK
jgi:thiol-disulfide isomerase/thioredoxin